MTQLLIIEIVLALVLVGVVIHAFLEMGRDDHDHEFDFTPFGKPKK